MRKAHRATEFARACRRLMIKGITLHSYRYAWAERAKTCGCPERFAQEALEHNSKAVHRAYARKAQFVIPTLRITSGGWQPPKTSSCRCRSRRLHKEPNFCCIYTQAEVKARRSSSIALLR
jgi:hypothetical protein